MDEINQQHTRDLNIGVLISLDTGFAEQRSKKKEKEKKWKRRYIFQDVTTTKKVIQKIYTSLFLIWAFKF